MPVEVEIETLFRPSSASVRQLLSDMVGGFAIPAYQRPYRWKPQDIRRLYESVIIGLERLKDDPKGVSFIGAIITVTGVSDRHEIRPKDARLVIDGQQRLSTILLMAAAAHEYLDREIKRLKWDKSSPQETELSQWVIDQGHETSAQLLACLADVKNYGDLEYRALPKIVREVTDVWSGKQDKARYISPVAHLLFGYLAATRADSVFKPSMPSIELLPEGVGSSKDDHEVLQRRFDTIRQATRDVANGKEGDLSEVVDLNDLLRSGSQVVTSLFDGITSDQVSDLRVLTVTYKHTAALLRIVLFSRFLLERVSLTQINDAHESYAFELFESLNSTGEPLTSFETFIPDVVENEEKRNGQGSYGTSDSYEHISSTSRLLSERADAVQTETSRLITSFLLADAGLKVPSKHNEQRRDLGKRYSGTESIQQGRAMTRQLADTALMYFRTWQDGALYLAPHTKSDLVLDQESQFCLGFLKQIGHTVVIAPLSRYFAAFRADPNEATLAELERAIKAITAFSVLWRAAHGGTDGIDSRYRTLMRDGVTDIVGPLARTNGDRKNATHDPNPLPSTTSLGAALRFMAGDAQTYAFTDQAGWVQAVKSRPIYEEQELARMLLLLASHHAIPEGTTGFTKDGALSDSTDMLRADRWKADDRLRTVEHIAPQNPDKDGTPWAADLYADQSLVHRIGNLVLLPGEENSWISNRPWVEKRAIYEALAAIDMDESKEILARAKTQGLKISATSQVKVAEARRHLPVLTAVGTYNGTWDRAFVERRGEKLLERAYTVLDRWITPK